MVGAEKKNDLFGSCLCQLLSIGRVLILTTTINVPLFCLWLRIAS